MLNEDTLLANLKTQEERQEELSKQQLGGLLPKNVPIVPHIVDIDNLDLGLDLGDLCPKFNLSGASADSEGAPRKSSNIGIT